MNLFRRSQSRSQDSERKAIARYPSVTEVEHKHAAIVIPTGDNLKNRCKSSKVIAKMVNNFRKINRLQMKSCEAKTLICRRLCSKLVVRSTNEHLQAFL